MAYSQRKCVEAHEDDRPVAPGHRLCAATRAELPADELIRFVADPGGEIVPDLSRRLPGRGVWLKVDKAIIAQAAAQGKIFAKSLKRQVKVNPDLANLVETLLVKRAMESLSLANKAGLVTVGYAQVDALIEGGSVALLLHGSDGAEGGREKLNRKFIAVSRASGRPAVIVSSLSTEQLSLALGRTNVVHAALKHGGMTRGVVGEAERLERYRSGSGISFGPMSAHNSEV